MTARASQPGRFRKLWAHPRLRLLVWTTLIALIFGAIEFGSPLDDAMRVARNSARPQKASGDIVLVAIDDRSLADVGEWPWSRRTFSHLIDRLRERGAERVFVDFDFSVRTNPADDRALAGALGRLNGRGVIALHFVIDPVTGARRDNFPLKEFRDKAELGTINVRYNAQNMVWAVPHTLALGGKDYPSFSALLSKTSGRPGDMIPIDWAIDPATVPSVSATDLLAGKVSSDVVRGKDVIIGATSSQLGDIYFAPGYRKIGGVYMLITAAETMKAGQPSDLGWLMPLLLALTLAATALFVRRRRAIFIGSIALFLFGPLLLDHYHIFVDVAPSLFLLIIAFTADSWRRFRAAYRERSRINPGSGLPNFNALREVADSDERVLIVARVRNYPEVCAALPGEDERKLVEQIVARLTVGAAEPGLYQGDEGIFAWFSECDAQTQIGEHLEALHALFRTPVQIGEGRFDLAITFGVDAGERSAGNRLGAALVAADEAASESLRWKRYDNDKLRDAPWKLSILSQLDAAIEGGDLWVAFQPKYDIATRDMVGAEALARWTHPDKGPIPPMEFVPAAEQSGRIEKLTEFVLERAVRAAALINRRVGPFSISVNISPKLIGRFPLEAAVMTCLKRYALPPECLTLEVTETAALTHGVADLTPLHKLRDLGVRISIDDYGTGLSTLEYVKRIPASEIKVDKSFVQAIGKSTSDRLMVNSTIQLAHSLGQKVVAEGVEDLSTLETLAAMGCDVAQGYFLAKPMVFMDLFRLVREAERLRAA